MKIIYIDNLLSGHHLTYMTGLIENDTTNDIIIITPRIIELKSENCKQIVCDICDSPKRNAKKYMKWICCIKEVIKEERPDRIVFLYGNYLLLYFGLGLKRILNNIKSVIVMHAVPYGITAKFQAKLTLKLFDAVITHSKAEKEFFRQWGLDNVINIEYPSFNKFFPSSSESRKYYGIENNSKVLLALGGTRKSKGLDYLLEAASRISDPFTLLIAGKEEYFKRHYIENSFSSSKGKMILVLKLLSDEEFAMAISAADIVVLPYRKNYFGPSGPMGESVAFEKCIIGPSNGTIGELIDAYHLGYMFESENVDSLATSIRRALESDLLIDEKYLEYKKMLKPTEFCKQYQMILESI